MTKKEGKDKVDHISRERAIRDVEMRLFTESDVLRLIDNRERIQSLESKVDELERELDVLRE